MPHVQDRSLKLYSQFSQTTVTIRLVSLSSVSVRVSFFAYNVRNYSDDTVALCRFYNYGIQGHESNVNILQCSANFGQ